MAKTFFDDHKSAMFNTPTTTSIVGSSRGVDALDMQRGGDAGDASQCYYCDSRGDVLSCAKCARSACGTHMHERANSADPGNPFKLCENCHVLQESLLLTSNQLCCHLCNLCLCVTSLGLWCPMCCCTSMCINLQVRGRVRMTADDALKVQANDTYTFQATRLGPSGLGSVPVKVVAVGKADGSYELTEFDV
mmetsp:Transcript_24906/g.60697  ORF Transcript_24906/g.60697 Transcript_24906/m.60697 type:complete len:192 (+) Transcript_24906:32-607(+)|eukprot:CAMPEP_0198309272 /NCGR_PEP_ID=MMETSP1450-20131203/1709_1 /TAXON_ID=753684 ORGANISM="Madagascaria erythrocladiodes, Strain CCMP3234" /NCGR_SAMPLE_ID=MMETSP1450 /ASSEMBLY_ACC=CAM_ASM_001115 /LENGTH=191 /DNA_ID=CAMNT_0044012023 /DNA_START=63 /DNA_END=638 /DNA_ORIENTATION=-